jgi:hypothetical protein
MEALSASGGNMMTLSRFNMTKTGAVAILTMLAGTAHAQTITTSGSVHVADNFYGMGYGHAGQVLWYTSPAGSNYGYYGYDPAGVGKSVQLQPGYVTITETGQNTGYGAFTYSNITQANDTPTNTTSDPYDNSPNTSPLEAGIAGSNSVVTTGSGLSLLTFTLGASVPSSLRIGILSDWSGAGDTPASFVLSSGNATATIADTGLAAGQTPGNLYLFTLSGLQPGQVITLSAIGGQASTKTLYSGITFDTVAAPEPSCTAALSLGLMGLGVLSIKARRRSGKASA